MLTSFELDRVAELIVKVNNLQNNFVFDPNIDKYLTEIEQIQSKCEHTEIADGVCVYCGKEIK